MAYDVAFGQGLSLNYDVQGTRGSPVIAIHSSGMSSRQWKRLADRLSPSHRTYLPDLIGYGDSTPWLPNEPFHFSLDVAGIEALIDSIGEPVHLVGHSYGGLLALHAALHRPRGVRSLSLVEPVAFGVMFYADPLASMHALAEMPASVPVLPDRATGETWLRWFVEFWNGPGSFDTLPERMRASFLASLHVCHGEVFSLMHDRTPARAWGTISVPSLFIRGELSPEPARVVAQTIAHAMPQGSLHDVAGAGHMSPLTHADQVAQRIARHIDAVDESPTL